MTNNFFCQLPPPIRLLSLLVAALVAVPLLADQDPVVQPQLGQKNNQYDYTGSAVEFKVEHNLSRIGITNEVTESRVQSKTRQMSVELARQKLEQSLQEAKASIRSQFCDQPPLDELCGVVPNDNTDFSELFVYMFILDTAQDSFDIFSWQSFIGMNWPLGANGQPAPEPIGTMEGAARVWSSYETPRELFDPDFADTICGDPDDDDLPVLYTSTFLQTGGYPLIDNNLNYAVYDLRVNDVMAEYIRANNLDTVDGQLAFAASGQEIAFPMGHYADPVARTGGMRGSAALKSAWKIIDIEAGDDPSRYYTIRGRIAIDAAQSETGKPFCVEADLGLVGMHIMQRNLSGNGNEWTWSTFEHVDNAPVASNARKPVDTLHEVLFEGGCHGPATVDREYAFYRPGCKGCATNHLAGAAWKWSPARPYAKDFASDGGFGSQVVRCWKIFEGTQLVNDLWREKLAGTVWANYESTSAQWKGAKESLMFPQGEVPRFLINTTMETYDQAGPTSSCLSCHVNARTVAGQPSNFSFLLNLAARYSGASPSGKLSAAVPPNALD